MFHHIPAFSLLLLRVSLLSDAFLYLALLFLIDRKGAMILFVFDPIPFVALGQEGGLRKQIM